MRRRIAQFVIVMLLGCGWSWAQVPTQDASAEDAATALPGAMAAAPEPGYADLLARLRSVARQADGNLVALRIEKWKVRGDTKEQLLNTASSIHRNLAYAVPELLQRAAADPNSMKANFVLYRDLNILYEAFTSLTESAGAFGPSEQYDMLAGDLSQFGQLRRELAERLEHMSAAVDARLSRPHAESAGGGAAAEKAPASAPAKKIIVDPNHPAHHRKAKSSAAKSTAKPKSEKPSAATSKP